MTTAAETGRYKALRGTATPLAVKAGAGDVADALPGFTPMPWSLSEIRAAIPARFFVRDTTQSVVYLCRDLAVAAALWTAASQIDVFFTSYFSKSTFGYVGAKCIRWMLWLAYWWFQGLVFTGIWVMGHECGHGAFSANRRLCDVVGFITHTFLWTPYLSWKISHHRHHSNHASMEHDEVYVPKTRSDLGIPQALDHEIDWEEYFGDTPIFTLYMLIQQQLLAFPAYLLFNVSGQKHYPKWTNHFDPNSILFKSSHRTAVLLSNAGIFFMAWAVTYASTVFGTSKVIKYYGIPWLAVTHWFVMITYLHHTDPRLPHYRKKVWNFQRGAAATVDRAFLGWQGRFFLHDVAHFHVIHHFFPQMPWYHGEEATQYLKAFLGEHYAFSDKPVFQALWDNYNNCQFVEDDGDVLFYKNRQGQAVRRAAAGVRVC